MKGAGTLASLVAAAALAGLLLALLKPRPAEEQEEGCLLYTSPSPRDRQKSRMPSSA